MTVDAEILLDGAVPAAAWALNEASLERTNRERMLEIAVAVDGRPLLRFGCDGVLCATPTGSTAYAFSAGGPIVWPNVDALLVVPNAAHALFARPIVVAPTSVVDIDLVSAGARGGAELRRPPVDRRCPAGARVRVRRGALPVRVVRLGDCSFADRLVAKFQLPVRSLREAAPSTTTTDRPGRRRPMCRGPTSAADGCGRLACGGAGGAADPRARRHRRRGAAARARA